MELHAVGLGPPFDASTACPAQTNSQLGPAGTWYQPKDPAQFGIKSPRPGLEQPEAGGCIGLPEVGFGGVTADPRQTLIPEANLKQVLEGFRSMSPIPMLENAKTDRATKLREWLYAVDIVLTAVHSEVKESWHWVLQVANLKRIRSSSDFTFWSAPACRSDKLPQQGTGRLRQSCDLCFSKRSPPT